MKRSTILINGLFCGGLSAAATHSLIQDYLGLEGTIQSIRDHWISATYTVPLALTAYVGVFCIAVTTMIIAKSLDAEDGEEDEES